MSNNEIEHDPFMGLSPEDIPDSAETEEQKQQSALNDFVASAEGGVKIAELPEQHSEVSFENIGEIDAKGSTTHPFVGYFSQKLSELDNTKGSKDKKYNGYVNKNLKSGWFSEFNESSKDQNPTHRVFCKPDSLFFIEQDGLVDALKQSGLSSDRANALQDKFDFVFIGNTSTRTKQANGNADSKGIKTYVLGLKDPNAPDAKEVLEEFKAARDAFIRSEIDNGKTLDSAAAEVIANKDDITSSLKGKRFFGTDDHLFLNNSATRAFLDTVPDLKGQYAVYPVKHESNKVKYLGEAPKMESFFTDNIELCEVKALKDGKLSQEELEHKVKEALASHPGHIMQTPQSAFTKQTVLPEAEQKAEVGNENPKKNEVKVKSDPEEDEYKKRKAKQQEGDDKEQERKSLATSLAEAAAKLTAAALEALVAIAKLIVAMILALLQVFLKGVNMIARQFDSSIPVRQGPSLIDTLDNLKFSKRNSASKGVTYDHNPEANDDLKNSKNLDAAISEDALSLETAPESTAKNTPELKTDIDQELNNIKADFTIDKEALADKEIKSFSPDQLESLKDEANDRMANLSNEQTADLLNNIDIKAAHSISPEMEAKIAPKSIYHNDYGVLLAKNDKVLLENGIEAGVLAAFSVAGKLHYATAHEKDGQYSISYTPAEKLTLLQHNGVQFDNEANLINQTVKTLMDKHGPNGKVAQIEILDHLAPTDNALSVRELASVSPLVAMNKLGVDLSPVDVAELVNRNMEYHSELYKSIPQLHTDRSGEPGNTSAGQTHPMFGRLLDINDRVESILPNGRIKVDGAVVGSYAFNDELYYQVQAESQVYNLKAQDLTLLKYNGGDLTNEEVAQRAIDKLFVGYGKPVDANADAKSNGLVDIPLRHINGTTVNVENPLGVHQIQRDITNSKILEPGTSNIGITPLNYKDGVAEGAGKIYSMNKSHFVSIGETTDPVNGMKRAVCAEIKKVGNNFTGMPLVKSRMVQLNLDDPKVMIAKNGISGADILDSVKMLAAKAVAIYEAGGLKKQAVVMAKFGNAVKSEILANNSNIADLAKESVIQNELATKILEAKAESISFAQVNEIGLDANLANSTVDLTAVDHQIENPEAASVMEQAPLESDAGTFTPNEIIENISPATEKEDFHSLSHQLHIEEQSLFQTYQDDPYFNNDPNADAQFDQNDYASFDQPDLHENFPVADLQNTDTAIPLENPVPEQSELISQSESNLEAEQSEMISQPESNLEDSAHSQYSKTPALTLINAAKDVGDGPHATSVKFVATYITGNHLTNNEDGVFDLLSEKSELLEMRQAIFDNVSNITHAISPAFEEIKYVNGIPDFQQSSLADPVMLKNIMMEDSQLRAKIQDLSVTSSNYQEMFTEHLDRVTETVSLINEHFNPNTLEGEDLINVNTVRDAFAKDSLDKLHDLTGVNNFAHGVSEMSSANGEINYQSIVEYINENTANSNDSAADRAKAIASSFSNQPEKTADKEVSIENRVSL